MKLDDFNNIDVNNAGSLPAAVKAVLLAFVFLIILALGYFVNNNPLYVRIHGFDGKTWRGLAPKTKVKAFAANRKEFVIDRSEFFEQLTVKTYPDGGINRIFIS